MPMRHHKGYHCTKCRVRHMPHSRIYRSHTRHKK